MRPGSPTGKATVRAHLHLSLTGSSAHGLVRRSIAGAAVLVLLTSAAAHAQPRGERGYLLGGVTVTNQSGPTGDVSELYVTAPGGWTAGWTLAAGARLAGHVSVEGEFAATGVMRAREPSRYDTTYIEERRDLFVGANVRGHAARASRFQLEPIAGVGLIRHQGWSQNEYARYTGALPVTVTTDPKQTLNLPISLGVTGGLDARIGGGRFALMPSFRLHRRVHRLNGENDLEWWYPGGMPAWTMRAGVLLRTDF